MSQPRSATPISPSERYEVIDIIRGFALFGVLLANMVGTAVDFALTDQQRQAMPTAGIDTVAAFFTAMLVEDKFYTIFSTLFGLGFAVQLSRASERGLNLLPTYTRRLIILFIIGALHAVLFWPGDVLHVYALLGFVLILFRYWGDRVVIAWTTGVALLILCFPLLHWIMFNMGWEYPVFFGRALTDAEKFQGLAHGGYLEVVKLNWAAQLEEYGTFAFRRGFLGWYLSILWKFLLGFYIGRRMILQRAEQHLAVFRRLLPWALVIGLFGNAFMAAGEVYNLWRPDNLLARALLRSLHQAWVFALSTGYVCILVLLHQRLRWRGVLGKLAPMGRMALTNYLSHTVCFVILFYGIGFGLLGKVGAGGCFVLSVAIFSAQISLSGWWLRHFRFGPVEWLWRSLTYWRLQPCWAREASRQVE